MTDISVEDVSEASLLQGLQILLLCGGNASLDDFRDAVRAVFAATEAEFDDDRKES